MSHGKYNIGQQVHVIADHTSIVRIHPDQLAKTFEIVRIVPGERDGESQYHLRSMTEPQHMRSVSESQLRPA